MTRLFDSHLCLPATLDALKLTSLNDYATHCNLDSRCALLSVVSDSSLFARNLALLHSVNSAIDPVLHVACAVHPLYCREFDDSLLHQLRDVWWPQMDAIGEIGLDFHPFDASYNYADHDQQRRVFVVQLEAALLFRKPLIIHTREADDETFDILDRIVPRDHCALLVHCFSSPSPAFVRRLLARFDNIFFGIAGNVTFGGRKNLPLIETIRDEIPLDRLLVETDAPFLSPVRGATNHSGHLGVIARRLAELKQVTDDEMLRLTHDNARRFLGKFSRIQSPPSIEN